ncbi:MAG: hypothetical protein ACRC1Y_04070 [Paraclostridium sp.]
MCEVNNIYLNTILECDYSLAFDLISLKRGISLLPKSLCKDFKCSDVSFIKLNDKSICREIGFSKLKENTSSSVMTFKDFAKDYFEDKYT